MPVRESNSWVITVQEEINIREVVEAATDVRYYVGQLERGQKTGRVHAQIYIIFRWPVNVTHIREMFGAKTWCRLAKGNMAENILYCSKDETRIEGTTTYEYIRLPQLRQCEAWAYVGPPRTGKSWSAFHENIMAYRKNNTKWWQSYAGQPVCVWDDFYPQSVVLPDLLNYLDIYPMILEQKGGDCELAVSKWIFTSNIEPYDWYPTAPEIQKQALMERIRVKYFYERYQFQA